MNPWEIEDYESVLNPWELDYDTEKPTVKTPEEIKARGEEAYKQMMADIDTERERQEVEDKYGWIKNNPSVNFGMSLASPSSVESIDAGKIPSAGDIFLDAGLNATGLIAAPERLALMAGKALPKVGRLLAPSASRAIPWKNIAVGAVEQGVLSGLEEGALSAMHDRDYSLTAPMVGTVGGGALGGTANTSMARKLVDGGFDKAEIPDVMRKLGTTEKGTLDALGKGGVENLDQIGVQNIKIPVYIDDVLEAEKNWLGAKQYKKIGADEALKSIHKSMDKIDRTPNISLKAKEKSLAELKELEDTFYNKLIKEDELNRKFADEIFSGGSLATAQKGGVDVEDIYKNITTPETNIPLAGYLKDVEATISNPNLRRAIVTDIAKSSGEEKALKGLLDKGKYEDIIEKTPEIIESGSILSTAKNLLNRAPHGTKTTRDVLKAPVIMGARAKDREEIPKREVPKYVNPSGYNSDGDLLYAPRGYITYADLWRDADEIKKKKNK